jgi:mannan endo-1,4-beta-mannosidase
LAGTQYLQAQQGKLEKQWRDSRKAKEDAHRLSGAAGSALVYQLPRAVRWCRVYAFFAKEPADFKCSVSADGQVWNSAPGSTQSFSLGSGDYGYWTPVLYRAKPAAGGGNFLKIEFGAEAQVGRVEIGY